MYYNVPFKTCEPDCVLGCRGGRNEFMSVIKVLQYDEDAQEAIVEIETSLYEETPVFQVLLKVFCQPNFFPITSCKISLFAFLVTNIVCEEFLQAPQKTNYGYFSYHLFARVLDVRNRRVQLGDIDIVLDCPIPKDISENSYISFDVTRLDLQY